MGKFDGCQTHECWEERMTPNWLYFLDNISASDLIGRILFSAFIIYYNLYVSDTTRSTKWPLVFTFIFCVLFLGNFFSGLFMCWVLCSQFKQQQHQVNFLKYPSIPSFFPKVQLGMDALLFSVLTLAGIYTRCSGLSDIPVLIFDEVHFGKFMNGHINGDFYYDIHPPIVKLLMAGFLNVFTPYYHGEQKFDEIGDPYLPTSPLKAMRFIPAFASALVVPVTYLTCRELGVSKTSSLICASMSLFDNLHVAEGRVLTTDTALLLFFALSYYFYIRLENSQIFSKSWYANLILTGISMGFTISTKWISLNIVGVVGICTVVDLFSRGHLGISSKYGVDFTKFNAKDFFTRLFSLLGIPFIIYVISFYYWIKTTPKWGSEGAVFMSRQFQASLEGSPIKPKQSPPSFLSTFIHLNREMFLGNRDVGLGQKGHPWESWWYQWPLDLRGLACWSSGLNTIESKDFKYEKHIYFLGNPFIWWFVALTLTLSPLILLSPRKLFKPIENFKYKSFILLIGFSTGLFPYAFVRRSCFIYHYMIPLHFLVLLSGIVIDQLIVRYFRNLKIDFLVSVLLIGLFGWSFWYFSVLTYGYPITKDQFEERIWKEGWR